MGNTFTISPLQCGKLVCLSPSAKSKICDKVKYLCDTLECAPALLAMY